MARLRVRCGRLAGLELPILRHSTPGHERAVLDKLAEVAPEVLHGADSLQTMHSFMAALALVLDDATFARVLLALAGSHPNACVHILSGDSGEVPLPKTALSYTDLPTQGAHLGATKSPRNAGRLNKIHESPAKVGGSPKKLGSPKKAGTPNRSPMRKGLSPLKATSPNVNRGSTREGSPDGSNRGSPQPQENAARQKSPVAKKVQSPKGLAVPVRAVPSRAAPSPTVQAAISRLSAAAVASSQLPRPPLAASPRRPPLLSLPCESVAESVADVDAAAMPDAPNADADADADADVGCASLRVAPPCGSNLTLVAEGVAAGAEEVAAQTEHAAGEEARALRERAQSAEEEAADAKRRATLCDEEINAMRNEAEQTKQAVAAATAAADAAAATAAEREAALRAENAAAAGEAAMAKEAAAAAAEAAAAAAEAAAVAAAVAMEREVALRTEVVVTEAARANEAAAAAAEAAAAAAEAASVAAEREVTLRSEVEAAVTEAATAKEAAAAVEAAAETAAAAAAEQTQAEMLKASEAVLELQNQLSTHVDGSYVPFGGGVPDSPPTDEVAAALDQSSPSAASPPAGRSPLAPPTESPKDTSATPTAATKRPPATPAAAAFWATPKWARELARNVPAAALDEPLSSLKTSPALAASPVLAAALVRLSTSPCKGPAAALDPPSSLEASPVLAAALVRLSTSPVLAAALDALSVEFEQRKSQVETDFELRRSEAHPHGEARPEGEDRHAMLPDRAEDVPAATAAAAAAVAVTVAVAPTERTDPAEARRLYGLAAAQGRTAAITPTPAVVAPTTAAVAPTPRAEEVVVPAPATPLLSLYRAVLGRAGTPARPSTLRRPLQVPDGSPTGRPPLSPLKLSQAQPAVPATPEVVRIGVEEFDDSPASRPAQLVTNPKPQTARMLQMAEEEPAEEGARRCSVEAVQVVPEAVEGRKEGGGEEGGVEAESGEAHAPGELRKIPSVVYRLGGNRLSTDAETGGLDTAGLDPEQREMLVQMQQAQELLEQDMQRLERQRQGQRRRDTTSPQPQP